MSYFVDRNKNKEAIAVEEVIPLTPVKPKEKGFTKTMDLEEVEVKKGGGVTSPHGKFDKKEEISKLKIVPVQGKDVDLG